MIKDTFCAFLCENQRTKKISKYALPLLVRVKVFIITYLDDNFLFKYTLVYCAQSVSKLLKNTWKIET